MTAAKPTTLDDLRAEYEAKLNQASDDAARLLREDAEALGAARKAHAEEVDGLKKKLAVAEDRLSNTRKAYDEERKAHNETKGELLDAMLQAERLRGYLAALRDSEPPRMVPEQREPHGENAGRYFEPRRNNGWGEPARPHFFARGAA